jgi:hypothetical protein
MFMSLPFPILLADIGEVIGALVGLVALLFWVIQKIAEANKGVRQPQRPPQQAEPDLQAPAAAQAGGRPAGQQADPLRNQVEEFLRRAGQAKQQAGQGAEQPRRPIQLQPIREIEVFLDDEPPEAKRRQVGAPMRPTQSKPAAKVASVPASDKRPARRSVIPRQRKTLAERATETATARKTAAAEHAASFGQQIIKDDAQFEVQLKAKFDHTVGTLAGSSVPAADLVPVPADSPAAQIARMLARPEGVRQAIVLNEVLNRPSDRW